MSFFSGHYLTEYLAAVHDLLQAEPVQRMDSFVQHAEISCLSHSLYVSYLSYKWARLWGLDSVSVARGALLHDFFLYDWHIHSPKNMTHGFTHPLTALNNAEYYFDLNALEKDIIAKHMFPLRPQPPKYRESALVCLVDKYMALLEILRLADKTKTHRHLNSCMNLVPQLA